MLLKAEVAVFDTKPFDGGGGIAGGGTGGGGGMVVGGGGIVATGDMILYGPVPCASCRLFFLDDLLELEL